MDSQEQKLSPSDPDLPPPKIIEGKDELNLAEFPLSAIADRLNPDQKTLTFEDRIWDESRGEMVPRQLTISAADNYGLPTALDDEVILGLVQLSKLRDFVGRKVPFTRYQLLQILGWSDDTKNYERLEKALNRWVGVTLYYKNAWWNKKEKCWMDEKFHILDNVTLYDRDRGSSASNQSQFPLSTFTWNDVIFRSFADGNLKSIDFDFYKNLKSSIAKRLYRFLDKRFFYRDRWEFNLKEVSWEHVGLARSYDAANLKRKLLTGIRELQAKDFIESMSDSGRFRKVRSGEWSVVFQKARPANTQQTRKEPNQASQPLVQALVERGITPSTAQLTVASFPANRIQAQLEVFDWLVTRNNPRVSRNPPGFLIASIKAEYAPPRDYVSRQEQQTRETQIAERKRHAEERAIQRAAKEQAQQSAREGAIQKFWQSLSDEERQRMETDALSEASTLQRQLIEHGGSLAGAARKTVFDAYALRILQQGA